MNHVEEQNQSNVSPDDPKWQQLRKDLAEAAERVGEHQWVDEEGDVPWIDEEELRAALVHAYSSGIDANVILSCKEACKSSAEFREQLENVTRDRLSRKRRKGDNDCSAATKLRRPAGWKVRL